MVALKGREIDAFLARPDPAKPIILVYGPDAGLVRERAAALLQSAVDDPHDPFSTVRLEGDELSTNPARLVEEAMTVPLFGGRRAIRVVAGARNFAGGVEMLAGMTIQDCRVVIEAGDLRGDAPLRRVCERAKTIAAIPCYLDSGRALERLIDEELGGAGLKVGADVRALLTSLLGGDRQASRNELRKLALYARDSGVVTVEAVAALVAEASELRLDPLIDSAFLGQPAVVEAEFAKALAAGTHPAAIIAAAQRQAAQLHKAALGFDEGAGLEAAVGSAFPRLHFSRKDAIESALRNFTAARLAGVIDQLAQAAFDMRRQSDLASAIAQRALIAVAANARRRATI